MPAKSHITYSVSVPVADKRFNIAMPKACCYCAKPLDHSGDANSLRLQGKSSSRTPSGLNSRSYTLTTRTVEFTVPYCTEHYEQYEKNLKTHSTIKWVNAILGFILVAVLCALTNPNGEAGAVCAGLVFAGAFGGFAITSLLTPVITSLLAEKIPSLKSLGDMMQSKGEDFSQRALGIAINPGNTQVEVVMVNPEFASMLAAANGVQVKVEDGSR